MPIKSGYTNDMAKRNRENRVPISFWKRTRPIWAGTAIGTAFMIFFLVVGNVEDGVGFVYSSQGLDGGNGVLINYSSIPFMMPIVGFFLGLMTYLWKKAESIG
jgi:hypothetical protein